MRRQFTSECVTSAHPGFDAEAHEAVLKRSRRIEERHGIRPVGLRNLSEFHRSRPVSGADKGVKT